MSLPNEQTEVEVKRGYCLYDGIVRKTVLVFRLNYDFYYELEKSDGFNMSDESPELNDDGHTYMLQWPVKDFVAQPGSFSVLSDSKALSLEGAMERAEEIIQHPIEWII